MKQNKWNNHRNSIDKFFKLSNKQWLKIIFSYKNTFHSWYMDIIVSNSKRQCNDCLRKSVLSSKKLYGKVTGNKLGVEALLIAKRELLNFEKTLHNTKIKIFGFNNRLINIYEKELVKHGYKTRFNERGRKYLIKYIN